MFDPKTDVSVPTSPVSPRRRAKRSVRPGGTEPASATSFHPLSEICVPTLLTDDADLPEFCGDHAIILFVDGVIREWNLGAAKLFGYAHSEVIGKPMAAIVPEFEAFMDLALGLETTSLPCVACRRKDGGDICVHVTLSRTRGDAATCESVLVAHDLSGIRQLEQQVRQAQKMEVFGQLAGGVAHDFNNLLTVILGYSEVIQRKLDVNDPTRACFAEIHKAGIRAESLTRQLLNFSRKQEIDMKVLDLNTVVTETETMLRRLIGEEIVLTANLGDDVGLVTIDPGQLQQLILNLAVNARDAMPRGGMLTIETDNVYLDSDCLALHSRVKSGSYAMLAISDTGVGMNAGVKARIFEPLFTTKGSKGTGLGLSTVKAILKQCHGHIEVHSEPGRGSSFKIYLPQVPHTQVRCNTNELESEIWPAGHETVLVVEDDDRVRGLARHVLELCGYTVLEAGDGADAMRRYEPYVHGIDLLVSDVVMPHMDGRCLADRLLALKPHMRVLFVSGYANEAVARHGVLDSESTFLQKPFSTRMLAQKVRQVLDQPA